MDITEVAPARARLAVVRRRIGLILGLTVVVPLVAVAYSATQENRYQATSVVLVNRQSVANQLAGTADIGQQQQSFQQVLVTNSKLARTPTVVRDALFRAGEEGRRISLPGLLATSSVNPNPDSDLLTFAVTRTSVQVAKRLSISYANAFVAYRRRLDGAALTRALRDVQATIARTRARGSGQAELLASLDRNRQQLETRLALQTANAQVVAGPERAEQVQPKPFRNGILGLGVGLILGLIAAFARDALDTRVRSGQDSEDLLGLPILSRLGVPPDLGDGSGLVMLDAPNSPQGESLRVLRTNLSFGLLSNRAKVLAVTSSGPGEGKSTTIANLAVAEALSGKRVAVIDLDLRRPRLATLFGLPAAEGLTTVALGRTGLGEALQEIELPTAGTLTPDDAARTLHVLPAGPLPPDPGEFVATEAVSAVLTSLRSDFDLVLVDAPPILGVSETALIANQADALFVCVRLGLVRKPMLTELKRALDRAQSPVLGQVVTGADADDGLGYYGYGYSEIAR